MSTIRPVFSVARLSNRAVFDEIPSLDVVKRRCGSCGYPLNLTSSSRITRCQEFRKKVYISFLSVDLIRFTQVDGVNSLPVSWGYGYEIHLLYVVLNLPTHLAQLIKKIP
ncbi:hypothetical protein SADUNF_Sadunf17G0052700 [Salix dunnii]|uniref:Uncharacterized protein n=1 Tax=Salix dunnii TaxID=1413687 RepID=A0A835J4M9_9ROSI|nr:hypothetical protein SADUNF_Sadunf17G0052700 [Salix dunnii]